MKSRHYIKVRIDRNTTQKHLVDLKSFLKAVFHNELHEEIAAGIIEYLVENKTAYLMKDLKTGKTA